jgi:hypothetical protein
MSVSSVFIELLNINHLNAHILNLGGLPDYWVMVRIGFGYLASRETLRAMAVDWVEAGCPDQVKNI